MIADLNLRPEAEDLVHKYSHANGPKAVFHRTDVREWPQLQAVVHRAANEFASVDIFCPGAGVYEPTYEDMTSFFWN